MKKVNILENQIAYDGFFKIRKIKLMHELFSGEMSTPFTRELFERKNAVCVLPYDPVSQKVLLVEQFRIGAFHSQNPWTLELVAGIIDKENESPIDVAKREAIEEAGLSFTEILPITEYYPSVGGSNEYIHLYLGKCTLTDDMNGQIHGLDSENENIKTHVFTLDELDILFKENKINNAATIIAYLWLKIELVYFFE